MWSGTAPSISRSSGPSRRPGGRFNLAKILYYLHHFPVDALVHINPLYCCPGDVTSALSSWVEQNFSVPVINLFYDGIHNPNENLKPYIHYLREKYRAGE